MPALNLRPERGGRQYGARALWKVGAEVWFSVYDAAREMHGARSRFTEKWGPGGKSSPACERVFVPGGSNGLVFRFTVAFLPAPKPAGH